MTHLTSRPEAVDVGALELRPPDPNRDFPAIVDLISDVNRQDSVPWFPTPEGLALDWAPSPTFDPERDIRLIDRAGRLVAGVKVEWRDRSGKVIHRIEPWTRPEARRQGLGRRLLAWAEGRARESVTNGSGGPTELPHFLGGGTGMDNPAGAGFAVSAGYRPVRYSFEMRRRLDEPLPDAVLPEGLELRPVRPADHRAIWDADVEAFRDHFEASERHEADYRAFYDHPDADTTLWQVAWDGSEVAGSVVNTIYGHENAELGLDIGWLDHVSVRRPWRRRGLASALIARSLSILRERGMAIAALGVDAENPTGALGVYERLGFHRARTWVTYRKPL
jgi:mycothiol synthase